MGQGAGVLGGQRTLVFGTEQSRHFNVLGTTTDNLYFAGNLFLGDHELKAGLDVERNEIYNAFLQNTRGNYTFNCISSTVAVGNSPACAQSLEAGRPAIYQVQAPQAGLTLNDGVAQWNLRNLGFFLQDTWSVNYNLTLVAGLRADRTGMPACVFEPGFGFERFVEFALDVPMYFVYRNGTYHDVAGRSFRDFMAGRLRDETAAHPMAQMQIAPEQGQLLQLLVRRGKGDKDRPVPLPRLHQPGTAALPPPRSGGAVPAGSPSPVPGCPPPA